jgi:hypothetical protein
MARHICRIEAARMYKTVFLTPFDDKTDLNRKFQVFFLVFHSPTSIDFVYSTFERSVEPIFLKTFLAGL